MLFPYEKLQADPENFLMIHESVLDTKLLVPAFRRKVSSLVEDTGEMTGEAGHRPAVLYREKIQGENRNE